LLLAHYPSMRDFTGPVLRQENKLGGVVRPHPVLAG
jgi:hypothetical protein